MLKFFENIYTFFKYIHFCCISWTFKHTIYIHYEIYSKNVTNVYIWRLRYTAKMYTNVCLKTQDIQQKIYVYLTVYLDFVNTLYTILLCVSAFKYIHFYCIFKGRDIQQKCIQVGVRVKDPRLCRLECTCT